MTITIKSLLPAENGFPGFPLKMHLQSRLQSSLCTMAASLRLIKRLKKIKPRKPRG